MKVWYTLILLTCFALVHAQEPTASEWLSRGRTAYINNELNKAVSCFDAALQMDAQLDTAVYNRALVYLELGRYGKALSDLDRFLAAHPADAEAYALRARAYYSTDQISKCINDLNMAVDLMPSLPFYLLRASAYLATQNLVSAESDYRVVLKRDDKSVEAMSGLGDVFFQKEDYLSARTFYREAARLSPHDQQIQYKLGVTLARLGNYYEALEALTDSVVLARPELASAARAFCYFRLGDLDAAKRNASYAKEANISNPDAWHMLGIIAAAEGKIQEAVQLFDEVIAIDPDYAQAWYNAGKVLYEAQDFGKAYEYLSHASEYREVKGAACMALANLKLTLGDEAEACMYFRLASQSGYEAHPEEDTSVFCR